MRKYGVPYKGSKNAIAPWVVEHLPPAETLVDLFAGGCAVTDCAMDAGKWKRFIINDIEGDITQLFIDAVNGKYKGNNTWVSRETFELLKSCDPFVRYCWSFGNNGRDYIYARELEPYKKAVHELLHCETVQGRRLMYKTAIRALEQYLITAGKYIGAPQKQNMTNYKSLQSLQSLERLESLERLQSLESLERLERYNCDYQDVPIPPDSVIYCDIPYKGTNAYGKSKKGNFDYDRFYDWAERQTQPVIISEYWMPEERFEVIAEREKTSIISATANNKVFERLYKPRRKE